MISAFVFGRVSALVLGGSGGVVRVGVMMTLKLLLMLLLFWRCLFCTLLCYKGDFDGDGDGGGGGV